AHHVVEDPAHTAEGQRGGAGDAQRAAGDADDRDPTGGGERGQAWGQVVGGQGVQHAAGGVEVGIGRRQRGDQHQQIADVGGGGHPDAVEDHYEGGGGHRLPGPGGIAPGHQRQHDPDAQHVEEGQAHDGGAGGGADRARRILGLGGRDGQQFDAAE